jgi:hypothetical protein
VRLDKPKSLINIDSPNLANIRYPIADNATDDIDRSVWLMPADQKWIVKSVVEKQQKRCGEDPRPLSAVRLDTLILFHLQDNRNEAIGAGINKSDRA